DEESHLQHAPSRPTGSHQPSPSLKHGRTQTQIMLRIAKNGPEPKVREAKWAAHHQTQGNTLSVEGR
ncbi:hypothetical protein, partial [Pseudorhodobacter antarcticus]|uniref:hypothetical protein n=1 Tax=Pseudorhodobacter antarcticus TaxID=1077947 RepID=UPI001E546EBB